MKSQSTHKILVVDDNNINIKLLTRTLTNNNFAVVAATNGEEAIEVAKAEIPDLILLDVLMPGMDGYETCKVIKETESLKHIPVIFLSAKVETVDKAKGLAMGGADYLTKPFDQVEIIARINSHIAVREDVIAQLRQNEILKKKLEELNNSQNAGSNIQSEIKWLDKLKNINYREKNVYMQFSARVKIKAPPVTTTVIPALFDNQNFIYLISGGFQKNYNISFVQMLMEQFVQGYFKSSKDQIFHEKYLYSVMDMILNQFSPSVYDAPFTLSLNYLNANKGEFTSFSIHQNASAVYDKKGERIWPEALPIFYDSKYAKIISAGKVKIPEKATIINYLSGKEITASQTYTTYFDPLLQGTNNHIGDVIDNVFAKLPDSEMDQMVMAVKLL